MMIVITIVVIVIIITIMVPSDDQRQGVLFTGISFFLGAWVGKGSAPEEGIVNPLCFQKKHDCENKVCAGLQHVCLSDFRIFTARREH